MTAQPVPASSVPAPRVLHDGEHRILHFSGHAAMQSRMSLLNPYALDLEYTRMMMGFVHLHPAPARIAMIGLGGGSLAKFCHRHLPGSRIEVAEIDPAVIALRESFHIPPDDARLRVIQADGADYVRTADAADILLVDGYGPQGMPEALCSAAFYADCHRMLAPAGMIVVNLHLESARYDVCLNHLREAFGTEMFEVIDDDMTNSVVFASAATGMLQAAEQTPRRPPWLSKDAWRQLMPTLQVIAATQVRR